MAAGCQMSKCRARRRLIGGKLRGIPARKAPKDRYRFTPSSSGRDTGCGRTVQFRFRFGFRVEKHGKARVPLFRFIGSAAPLDDHSKSGYKLIAQRFAKSCLPSTCCRSPFRGISILPIIGIIFADFAVF